jgi:uncharacterized protein YigA (DUF484 family)
MNKQASTAKPTAEEAKSTLAAEDVVAYLRENPDFFLEQEDLLADLLLPHESGKAISLLERQVTILRERGIEARQKLNNLLENARNNDQLFDTTRNLVLALLRARDVTEIVEVAVDQLSNHANIDACEVILLEQPELNVAPSIRVEPLSMMKQEYADVIRLKRTHCGSLTAEQIGALFPGNHKIKSTALCPVINNSEVLALLALGNQEENYFNIHLDTLFLDFIGHVVGAVLERQLLTDSTDAAPLAQDA